MPSLPSGCNFMNLHEYQSKQIFLRYGIPIPRGKAADNANEVQKIAEELGGRVVVKAQVLVGGRGKAGGIRLAKSPAEARELAAQILGMQIKGLLVRRVLVDEAVSIDKEIYLGITNDRTACKPTMIASAEGGVDIEEVARRTPEKIHKVQINALLGLHEYQSRNIALGIDLPREYWQGFNDIARKIWTVYRESDASLVEINPLVITKDRSLIALDGKMIIDDNALFRQTEIAEMRDLDVEAPAEIEAGRYGLSYIKLDGEIGCMVNGAGLAMATMDIIKLCGGNPANFLDVGGGASSEKVAAAFRLVLSDRNVKAILINIFGGITRGDEVARGILSAIEQTRPEVPIVIRLVGTNAEEGMQILSAAKLITAETLYEAAQKVVAAAGVARL